MQRPPEFARRLCTRFGLSILELTICMAAIVAIGLYVAGTLVTSQPAQAVKLEMRRSMRSVADTIERDIRRAGFMVPASGAVCAVDNLGSADLLYLSDADALAPEHGASGQENGASLPGDNVVGGLNPAWSVPLVLDARATYDNDGDGIADADFLRQGGVIVTDRSAPERGSACGTVVDVDLVRKTVTVDIHSSVLGPGSAADLVAIPGHEYRIVACEVLSRDGQPLVRGAADLQVAFFIDANHDNIEQVDELVGDGTNSRYVSGQVDLTLAREIRVDTVLLTRESADGGEARRRIHTTRELLRTLVMR